MNIDQVLGKKESIELNTRSSVNFYVIYSKYLKQKIDDRVSKTPCNTPKARSATPVTHAVSVTRVSSTITLYKTLLAGVLLATLLYLRMPL